MNLRSQVISLPLAKQIDALHKERGIEVESYFSWYYHYDCDGMVWDIYPTDDDTVTERVHAYTSSDLGEMLLGFKYPATLQTRWYEGGCHTSLLFSSFYKGKISKARDDARLKMNKYYLSSLENLAPTEAEARGLLYLYCLENKII